MDINREVRGVFPQEQSAGTFTGNYQRNGVWFAGAVRFLSPSVLAHVGPRSFAGEPSNPATCSHGNMGGLARNVSAAGGHVTYGELAVVASMMSGGPGSVLGVQIFHRP